MLNGLFMYVKVRILRIIRKKKTLNAKNNAVNVKHYFNYGLNEPIEPVTLVLKEDEDDRTTNDKRYR